VRPGSLDGERRGPAGYSSDVMRSSMKFLLLVALAGATACASSQREIRRAAAKVLPCAADRGTVLQLSGGSARVECEFQGVHLLKQDGAWIVVSGPDWTTDVHVVDDESYIDGDAP